MFGPTEKYKINYPKYLDHINLIKNILPVNTCLFELFGAIGPYLAAAAGVIDSSGGGRAGEYLN